MTMFLTSLVALQSAVGDLSSCARCNDCLYFCLTDLAELRDTLAGAHIDIEDFHVKEIIPELISICLRYQKQCPPPPQLQ